MKGSDHVEKVVKYMVTTEHGVFMDELREETLTDDQLQKLSVRIQSGHWDKHKKDPKIAPLCEER